MTRYMEHLSFGEKKNPPLIILHGWGSEAKKYEVLARILAKHFYVLIPDLPGFGKTPEPSRPYGVGDYVTEVKQFLKDQSLSEALFLCHSFGGRIGMKLAAHSPKLVKALFLTGAAGVEALDWKRSLKRCIYWCLAKGLKLFSFLPPLKRLKQRFYKKRDYGQVEGVMKKTFLKVIKEKSDPDAKKVKQPTFLLWGRNDMMTMVCDAQKILHLVPQSHLKILSKVGHRLPYERPHECAREALQFFLAQP